MSTEPNYQHLVDALATSNARIASEMDRLLGELRAERASLTDELLVTSTDSTGVLEWTSRSSTNAFLMTGLIVVTPTGTASASIQVGELILPVQNTFFKLDHLGRQVLPQDRRRLVLTPATVTPVTVYLWGKELPLTQF